MNEQFKSFLRIFFYILLWLIFTVLATLTFFQLHGTIIAIAIYIVNNPAIRPIGWNTGSVALLSRLLWLIMGILWLGWVMYTYEYLREGNRIKNIIKRGFRLLLILGAVYLSCYILLVFLP